MTNNYDSNGKTRSSYEEQICEILEGCLERGDLEAGATILRQDEGRGDLSPKTHDKYRGQFGLNWGDLRYNPRNI